MKMLKPSILHFGEEGRGGCIYLFIFDLGRESHGLLRGKKEKLIYLLLCIPEPALRTKLYMTGVKSIACA